ncbi:histidine kinase N-terminal 7TM domain-containing diguanylate cyclase [Paenibacillus aceris]|uniref:Diguanylate cyclase (GGDEF)-like protein/PAS domain S-box-containing protein n=1 Tax=Paenibacillus aceris TaxID=869555 RepID=A0ABS4I5N7_9BACL|nr:diguanylate cyclase [Paenibacillus aceris]MBP1965424.1 diguanylate cyclase (GGDEF)-like protein/PAS domain S-box-containing protein [Paenibacillus aceris]NHW33525.1 diguanylate cyclase [Paenibacillus aceris]
MNEISLDFLTILLPSYMFFYMAITVYARNKKSLLNRVASFLMLALLFYFLGEYIKTALFPQFERHIVLYWNAPMLLLAISILVHLCMLVAGIASSKIKQVVFWVYLTPLTSLMLMLMRYGPQHLYQPREDGPSPLSPLMLVLAIFFVGSYLLLSVGILLFAWITTQHLKRKRMLVRLLASLFTLLIWILFVTFLLSMAVITSSTSIALYFSGTLLWVVSLRGLISKYDFLPSYRDLFHTLFKSAPTAILLLDMQGSVREMNPRAESLFGYPAKGADGLQIVENLFFDQDTSLIERWSELSMKQTNMTKWEMKWKIQDQEQLDMIVSMEHIDGAEEGLIILHLTDITSLKETERRLIESESNYRHLAYHDPLTGLFNRAAVHEHANRKIANDEQFALILVDLDHFKPVNDTHGHLIGDDYLKHIAALLELHARPGDIVGRIGGDEFVLLMPFHADEKQVYQEAHERLFPLTVTPFRYKDKIIPVSFSAGVSQHANQASDLTALLQKADEAMYAVKRSGKSAISVYDSQRTNLVKVEATGR